MKTMRTIRNKQLTLNFWLHEFIEAELPYDAVVLNWKHINEFSEERCLQIAQYIQKKRDYINSKFRAKNAGNEIKIKIMSGFRCIAWEILRKRDGKSQHTKSWAVDGQPDNCSPELAIEIIQHLQEIDGPVNGHKGGFAIKKPEYKDGKIIKIGFVHYDLRGVIARWEY
jgi:hypothetical protein